MQAGTTLALVAVLASPGPAAAATPSPGVAPVTSAGVELHAPADGRLNGYQFTCDVPGYRFTDDIGGSGPSSIQPDPGDVLLVFGLTCTSSGSEDNELLFPSPAMSIVIDGQAEAVPTGGPCSGACYWVTEAPTSSRSVVLRATGSNGYSQEFSFTLGHRVGPQPQVLYASRDDWQVTDDVGSSSLVKTPDPAGKVHHAAVDIAVSSVSLSYFSPADPTTTAPRPDQAWLVVKGSAEPAEPPGGSGFLDTLQYQGTLTANDLSLDLPGHRRLQARLTGRGGQYDEAGQGLFGGTYYFGPIPAGARSAVLHIALPGHLPALDDIMASTEEVPVKSQPAPVHLSFPAPYRPAPLPAGNPPAWDTSSSSAVPGGTPVVVVLMVVVAALAALGYVVLRRRRLVPALADLVKSPDQKRSEAASAWLAGSMSPRSGPFADGTATVATAAPAVPEATSRVLVPLPVAPPVPAPGEVWFCVLGSPEVSPAPTPELSQPELEIGCFLACRTAKPWSGQALRAAMGAGRADEWSERTVVTYVNGLRRKLGAGHVPDASSAGGYCLVDASTDFAELTKLVASAEHDQPGDAAVQLARALSLVRGAPFRVSANYGWADLPDDGVSLSSQMLDAVMSAAERLVRIALDAGDAQLARWAVGKGLMLEPLKVSLARAQLDAAAATGDASALEPAWSDITRRYGAQHVGVPEELAVHLQLLRKRLATPAAMR